MEPHPLKPGDWVASPDHERVAKVRDVYWIEDEPLADLWMYDHDGQKLGRVSPIEGGPRGYEPACDARDWVRISEPRFPIVLKWIPNGNGVTMGYIAGKELPPANYVKRQRKGRRKPVIPMDDKLRKALEAIAAGHNDPRTLAKQVLTN